MKLNEDHVQETYTFQSFKCDERNEEAVAACKAVAENPAADSNPLLLTGESGCGKTHLLLAIRNVVMKKPDFNVIYTDMESYVNEVITAIRDVKMQELRERYRTAQMLLFDDLEFIAGKEATTEEFYYTIKDLCLNGYRVVVTTSDPAVLERLPEHVAALFRRGRTIEIGRA